MSFAQEYRLDYPHQFSGISAQVQSILDGADDNERLRVILATSAYMAQLIEIHREDRTSSFS